MMADDKDDTVVLTDLAFEPLRPVEIAEIEARTRQKIDRMIAKEVRSARRNGMAEQELAAYERYAEACAMREIARLMPQVVAWLLDGTAMEPPRRLQ